MNLSPEIVDKQLFHSSEKGGMTFSNDYSGNTVLCENKYIVLTEAAGKTDLLTCGNHVWN